MLNESYSRGAIWHSPGTRQEFCYTVLCIHLLEQTTRTKSQSADEITKIDDALQLTEVASSSIMRLIFIRAKERVIMMRVITGTSNDNVNTVDDVCVFDTDMNECENVQYYCTSHHA